MAEKARGTRDHQNITNLKRKGFQVEGKKLCAGKNCPPDFFFVEILFSSCVQFMSQRNLGFL
jgi:hypothetical protein